jgi:hypothetical protein
MMMITIMIMIMMIIIIIISIIVTITITVSMIAIMQLMFVSNYDYSINNTNGQTVYCLEKGVCISAFWQWDGITRGRAAEAGKGSGTQK